MAAAVQHKYIWSNGFIFAIQEEKNCIFTKKRKFHFLVERWKVGRCRSKIGLFAGILSHIIVVVVFQSICINNVRESRFT